MRIASGSLVGAAVAGGSSRRLLGGALLGGLAAAGAYGGLALRNWARRRFRLPDTLVGAVEDAVAVGAGIGLGEQFDAAERR
jgi:hypothetical protein